MVTSRLVTVMAPEKIASRRPAQLVVVMASLKMVSKEILVGLPLVGAILIVADLHHLVPDVWRVMVLGVQEQVLLVRTRAGDVLNLNLSRARGVTNIQDLLDELPGVDIRNLQILEGKTTLKIIVVVQPLIVLRAPPPFVYGVVEHIQVGIAEHMITGKVHLVSAVD